MQPDHDSMWRYQALRRLDVRVFTIQLALIHPTAWKGYSQKFARASKESSCYCKGVG